MRIFFVGQLPPPLHGVTIINKSVLEYLKSKSDVFAFKIGGSASLKEIKQGSRLGKSFGFFFTYVNLLKSSLSFRPDIAYFTPNMKGPAFYRDLIIALTLKLTSKKIVYHLHGLGIAENIQNPIRKLLYNLMLRNSTIICVSKTVSKSEFISFSPNNSKITFASNSVDFEEINSLASAVEKKKETTLIHMANFRESKGTMDVITTFASLRKKHPNLSLTLIGTFTSDEFEERCKNYIEKEKIRGIKITGHLEGQNKIKSLAEGHIFVYPTYDDSFGLVIIEAMACGLPVVAYDIGSVPELIEQGKNGYIIQKGNKTQLESTLNSMICSLPGVTLTDGEIKEKIRESYNMKDYPERVANAIFLKQPPH